MHVNGSKKKIKKEKKAEHQQKRARTACGLGVKPGLELSCNCSKCKKTRGEK